MSLITIPIEMPCDQAAEIYRLCSERRITLDELVDQFMRWCIREPEAFKAWYGENRHLLNEQPMALKPEHRRLDMPEITEDELVAHIEDDDFLLVYGNPILIRSKDGRHDCVLMSIEYYERQQRMIEQISAMTAETVSGMGEQRKESPKP